MLKRMLDRENTAGYFVSVMKIWHKYEANMGYFHKNVLLGLKAVSFLAPQGDSSKNVDFLPVEIKLLMSLLEMLNSL